MVIKILCNLATHCHAAKLYITTGHAFCKCYDIRFDIKVFKCKHPCIGDVRYIGLFSSIELVKDRKTKEPLVPYGKDPEGTMGKIIGMLKAKKFMTYSHENMIFVNPALIITEEQLREEMVKVDEVLTEVDAWLTI